MRQWVISCLRMILYFLSQGVLKLRNLTLEVCHKCVAFELAGKCLTVLLLALQGVILTGLVEKLWGQVMHLNAQVSNLLLSLLKTLILVHLLNFRMTFSFSMRSCLNFHIGLDRLFFLTDYVPSLGPSMHSWHFLGILRHRILFGLFWRLFIHNFILPLFPRLWSGIKGKGCVVHWGDLGPVERWLI